MFECKDILYLLPFYIEGKLSAGQKAFVEKHLANCETCMDKYIEMQNIADSINKFFEDFSIPNEKNQKAFFKKNISAYMDNELPMEDYLIMTKMIINDENAKKEIDEMYDFQENLQFFIKENQKILDSDLSSSVVKEIRNDYKNSSSFLWKTAIIFVVFIALTLLIGYFSFGYDIDYLSKLPFDTFNNPKY